jgi:hypothetical protein
LEYIYPTRTFNGAWCILLWKFYSSWCILSDLLILHFWVWYWLFLGRCLQEYLWAPIFDWVRVTILLIFWEATSSYLSKYTFLLFSDLLTDSENTHIAEICLLFAEWCNHEGAGRSQGRAQVHWGVPVRKPISIDASTKACSAAWEGQIR